MCDDAVDRMRREAARVSEIAQCRADRRKAEEERQAIEAALVDLQARRTDLMSRWAAIWAEESIEPGAPEVMRDWLELWSKLKARVEALEKSAPEIKRLGESIDEHKAALRTALALGDRDESLTLA